jgi:hypothetical protein
MYYILDMFLDNWVKSIILLKFLPGLIIEASTTLADNEPKEQE